MRERERGCQRGGGDMRPFITTANSARDMDLIRQILGEETLSFIGWAYGSRLGAVYGTMFPQQLDRSVLDSSVHPDWDWQEQFATQAVAIRESVDAWARWTGERNSRFQLGHSAEEVLAQVEAVAAMLADFTPTATHRTLFDGRIGQLSPLRTNWDRLADSVAALRTAAAAGDVAECDRDLANTTWRPGRAAGGFRDAVLEAITCETPWPKSLEPYFQQMRKVREQCPYGFGVMRVQPWVGTFASFTPVEWPVSIVERDYPKGLVVQADHDPWDYKVGAIAMAQRLDHCLIEVVDSGAHEIYVLGGNQAVDQIVHAYLVRGELPADRVRCPGEAKPDVPADVLVAEPAN